MKRLKLIAYLCAAMNDKLNRMLELVGDFFDVKNDPEQLSITDEVMNKLHAIHPSTMSEYNEGDGPIVWILLIPVREATMNCFLKGDISETQLFEETSPREKYDAVYLCSASVLQEYRGKGLAKKLTVDSINEISKQHSIKTLFYWPFSKEGTSLAESIAKKVNLPLYTRESSSTSYAAKL